MHAVAKVAWEVINGVRGRRRRNEEKEEEEESIDKASHKIEVCRLKSLEGVLWGNGFLGLGR